MPMLEVPTERVNSYFGLVVSEIVSRVAPAVSMPRATPSGDGPSYAGSITFCAAHCCQRQVSAHIASMPSCACQPSVSRARVASA